MWTDLKSYLQSFYSIPNQMNIFSIRIKLSYNYKTSFYFWCLSADKKSLYDEWTVEWLINSVSLFLFFHLLPSFFIAYNLEKYKNIFYEYDSLNFFLNLFLFHILTRKCKRQERNLWNSKKLYFIFLEDDKKKFLWKHEKTQEII